MQTTSITSGKTLRSGPLSLSGLTVMSSMLCSVFDLGSICLKD